MGFTLEETTIAAIRTALRARELTCTELVSGYLARIDADDQFDRDSEPTCPG